MQRLLDRGLEETAPLWGAVESAYGWVHRAAHILDNEAGLDGAGVRRRLRGLLGALGRWRGKAGYLEPALAHFMKVTRSYWPGLFHCYDVPDLPRTNNDLEHLFGSHRYHERRSSGRKTASPALVVRGTVRLIAAVATRLRRYTARELAPADAEEWRTLRTELEERRHTRTLQRRFRRDPEAYLSQLEQQLVKLALPP